jgi:hypothetical protein
MRYLFLLLPVALLVLSMFYNNKYKKMKGTGKVPVIIAARRNTALCLALALTTTFVILLILKFSN